MELTRHFVRTIDGVEISYTVFSGMEPAVVILHGLAGSGREFLPTAQALSGRKVVLVDQRGHGLSTRLPADTSREAFVRDVVAVIDREATVPVHLIGHSMGAHTAMLAAATRPDLINTLVLLEGGEGSGTYQEHEGLLEYFRSWPTPFADRDAASEFLGDGPLQRAWIDDLEEREDGLHPRFDAEVMFAAISAVAIPRWKEWSRVQARTLVIYADGGMFTEEQKARFVSRGQDVLRVDIPDASHDAHLDAFDHWIDAVTGFLNNGDKVNKGTASNQ